MEKFYPPYFPCYIPLPNGKPAAGGKLYAYFTGTNNLAPLYAEDGTVLVGSVADIDSSGQVHVLLDPAITYRLKVVPPVGSQMPDQIYDNVRVANGTIVGMENPMTDQGDIIVGSTAGVPVRLAHPNGIGFLRATISFGMKVLQWVGLIPGTGISIQNDGAGATISVDDSVVVNPMTAEGDLIVGGADGVPSRLAKGADGKVLTMKDGAESWEDTQGLGRVSAASGDATTGFLDSKLEVATPLAKEVTTGQYNIKRVELSISAGDAVGKVFTTTDNGLGVLVPTWQTPTGMENPMTAKADIIVGGASGAPDKLAAPANASFLRAYKNSSNENVVNWSKLSAGSGVTITDAGTQVTIAADTQTGDHKTAVDGADASPDYLANKLAAGSGIALTNTGSAVEIAATAQTGDHQLLVSATDAAAGYLGAKLTAGANVTLTPQTDGDGVQTLEISATGGGGGGGSDWSEILPATNRYYQAGSQASGIVRLFHPRGASVRSVMVMTANYKVGATCAGVARIYKMQLSNGNTEAVESSAALVSIAKKDFSLTVKNGTIWVSFDADVDVSDTSCQYYYAIGFNNGANPNPSDYLRFQLSAAVSTTSTSTHSIEFHTTTNKLIDSTTLTAFGFSTSDYTYVSGISSKVES